ncbi:MAG TPA: DUF5666 domain-containing protein [Verrucomicrobiae bacterium]|jgi:hypothetical protein|nr:DUF5666 domain-containing protein [Verrucomicrobiae bacterium]
MKMKMLFMLALAALICQGPAFAETIEGTLTNVDKGQNTISVSRVDPKTNAQEVVNLFVTAQTEYKGQASSLADLESGNDVRIEADKTKEGQDWQAKKVEKKDKAAPGAGLENKFEGELTAVNKDEKTLSVKCKNPKTNAEETLNMHVTDGTQYKGGYNSLNDLQQGQKVNIQADQNYQGKDWQANVIEKK